MVTNNTSHAGDLQAISTTGTTLPIVVLGSFIHISYLQREIIAQNVSAVAGVDSLLCEWAAKLQVVHLVLLLRVKQAPSVSKKLMPHALACILYSDTVPADHAGRIHSIGRDKLPHVKDSADTRIIMRPRWRVETTLQPPQQPG